MNSNVQVDLAALVRSKGIELKKHGSKDLCGLSPFTDEKTPSFIVTPGKNLWHCMSSGKGGSVIDFVMQYDGVSFREAVELLKDKESRSYTGAAKPVKKSTIPKLPPPVAFDADDQTLLRQVLDYYAERLKENPAALDYLKSLRGIVSEEALKTFRIGYADRTLGLRLPHKNRKDGAEIRHDCRGSACIVKPGVNTLTAVWSSRSVTENGLKFRRSTGARRQREAKERHLPPLLARAASRYLEHRSVSNRLTSS